MMQYKEAAPLKLKDRTINPKNGIFLMGILNVTPDSFFAESRATELDKALEKAFAMVETAQTSSILAQNLRAPARFMFQKTKK